MASLFAYDNICCFQLDHGHIMELDANAIVGRVLMKGHENSSSAAGNATAQVGGVGISIFAHI